MFLLQIASKIKPTEGLKRPFDDEDQEGDYLAFVWRSFRILTYYVKFYHLLKERLLHEKF